MSTPRPLADLPPTRHRVAAYWTCQLAGWGGYAVLNALGASQLDGISGGRALLEYALLGTLALLLTHQLRRHMQAHHWQTMRWPALLWRISVASVLLGGPLGLAYHFSASNAAALAQLPATLVVSAPVQLLLQIINWSALIGGWATLYFIVLTARRRRDAELRESELQRALQFAELRLLKSQLNPHFLFNSLNSVRALIAEDVPRAQDAVTRLARLLRYTLGATQQELATLEQELEVVADYLDLEGLRLGERLQLELQVEPQARTLQLPVMLLQTLVENAIKHGVAELPAGGLLKISARRVDHSLEIQVENPRPARSPAGENAGLGLLNAAERLRLLYGDRASLQLDLTAPQRALATLRVPA